MIRTLPETGSRWLARLRRLETGALRMAIIAGVVGHGSALFAADDAIPVDKAMPGTMLYTVIVFLIVLFVLGKFAWKPLMQALDERERKIRESLDAADRVAEERAAMQAEHDQLLQDARKEATAVVEEGRRDAQVVKDKMIAEARQGAEEIKDKALADIGRAKDHAIHDLQEYAVGLSLYISEKLIDQTLDAKEHKKLIDEAIESYGELG